MLGSTDKTLDKTLLTKLEELGLSEKESLVYLALLPLQDTGTSSLIRATGLHGQFVYAGLERLEELGLAKHVIQNGRKKFSANPPARLLSLVEKKRVAAQSVASELQSRFAGRPVQDFEVLQGQSAFVAHQFESLESMPDGGTVCVLGGGGDKYIELMGHEIDSYEKRRIAKKVQIRYLSTGGSPLYLQVMAQTRKLFDYRVLPSPAPGVDTEILVDKIIFHLLGEPVVSFSFTNKVISDGYKKFFEVLWSVSAK